MELSHPHTWSGVKFCDSFNSCELFPETMNRCSYVSLGSLKGFDSTISFLGGESLGSLLGGGSLSSLPPGFGSLEDFENDKENPKTPCSTTQSLFRVSPISVRPSGFLCPPVAKLESADPTERQRRWTASINSRVRCPMSMDCCPVDEPSRRRAGTKSESSAGGHPHTWSGVKFCDSFNSCELFPETMNRCSYVSLGSLKEFDSTISFLGGESLGSLLG